MRTTIKQHDALHAAQARRAAAIDATAGQCRAVEREWAARCGSADVRSAPRKQDAEQSERRDLEVVIAVAFTASAIGFTTWLAVGGIDLIRSYLP